MENYALAAKRADYDALTSILNRGAGEKLVEQLLAKGQKGAFIIVDIDNFKHINDTYGHQTGDEVICKVAGQLKSVFCSDDVIWRLGGDEFAIFASDPISQDVCKKRLHQMQRCVSEIQVPGVNPFNIEISMGCSIFFVSKSYI